MTREEWLQHAVEEIDITIFGGDLDIINHSFQISCGRCPGRKSTECVQPSDSESVTMDDFFPTTISVDYKISDPYEMLTVLAYECIRAFFNVKGCNKQFKSLAEKYYFEPPYKEIHPSIYLTDLIKEIHNNLVNKYGEFPGKAVKFPTKEKKDGKKNTLTIFCPECGYELKVSRKVFSNYNNGLPTCMCGSKMAVDLEEQQE